MSNENNNELTNPIANPFASYVAASPPEVPRYNEFFTKAEFACKHCGQEIQMNPKLIDFLTDVRKAINLPIRIHSGYRCPEHNKAVGGVPNSQHVLGEAADWSISGFTGKHLEQITLTYSKGRVNGRGRSDFTNYIHTDCRENSIHLAKWCYGVNGSQIPYYDA